MKRKKSLSETLPRIIHRYAAASGIRRIIATVSGGADSICMLSACQLAGIDIIAAHCNFHLRGEESDRDQHFVEKICRHLNVPLETIHFNIPDYISSHKGVSVEMACRNLRHEWFRTVLSKHQADRIATGHNADDNAETILLNLLRGSGTNGLKGMFPDNGTIWRPILHLHRPDIIEYLSDSNLTYITDSTNLESDYRRNFLRNEIIPLLRSKWPGADAALQRSIKCLRGENRIVEFAISEFLPPEGKPLEAAEVLAFPDPESLVRRYIDSLNPFATTSSEIIDSILAEKSDKKTWHLPGGTLTLRGGKLYKTGL